MPPVLQLQSVSCLKKVPHFQAQADVLVPGRREALLVVMQLSIELLHRGTRIMGVGGETP